MRRQLRRILWVTLFGVVLYGAFAAYTGFEHLAQTLSAFDWWQFAAALALASCNYGLRIMKWQYYLKVVQIRGVRLLDSVLIFLSGFVLTVTPGKVGEVFKSAVMAETHGVPPERTAPIVIAERLTDVFGVIVIILIGSMSFAGGLSWAVAGLAAVAIGMTLILWEAPVRILLNRAEAGWMRSLVPRLRSAYSELRRLASPKALLWPTLLSILGWGCEGTALLLLLEGFGQTTSWAQACFFYATATLAGALIPVPGGLGVTETLIQQQLVHLGGVESGAATASMLLLRFATLWWAVLVGFAALGLLKLRFPNLLSALPDPAGASPKAQRIDGSR